MHVPKDSRYTTIRIQVESNNLKNIADILDYIPASILAQDLPLKPTRLNKIFANPAQFTMHEMHLLAELIDCDFKRIFHLLSDEVVRLKTAGQ